MLWLDSAYPLEKAITDKGVKRGSCSGGVSSTPAYLRTTFPNSYVTFANAAIGEIGSTQLDKISTMKDQSPVWNHISDCATAAACGAIFDPNAPMVSLATLGDGVCNGMPKLM